MAYAYDQQYYMYMCKAFIWSLVSIVDMNVGGLAVLFAFIQNNHTL